MYTDPALENHVFSSFLGRPAYNLLQKIVSKSCFETSWSAPDARLRKIRRANYEPRVLPFLVHVGSRSSFVFTTVLENIHFWKVSDPSRNTRSLRMKR